MKFSATILIFAAFPMLLTGQSMVSGVERLTIDDGLSQNYIYTALQDHIGYLWFGTKDGLNKYDGHTFTVYRNDRDDPFSISDNTVTALFEDSLRTLWIGTSSGGLLRFDRQHDRFERINTHSSYPANLRTNPISLIYESPANVLWVGTRGGGAFRYDHGQDRFDEFSFDSGSVHSVPNNFIEGFAAGRSGEVWIATGGGLARFDPRTGMVTRHLRSMTDLRGSLNLLSLLLMDRSNALWVGHRLGFDRVSDSSYEFERVLTASDSTRYYWPSKAVDGGAGTLWVGFVNDIVRFNPKEHRAQSVLHISPERFTKSIMIDRSGIVWIGSTGWGVYKYNPRTIRFGKRSGNFLEEVYAEGIAHIRRRLSDGSVFNFSLRGGNLQPMFMERSGTVWITPPERPVAYRYDPADRTMQTISTHPEDLQTEHLLSVKLFFQGKDGTVWASMSGGIGKFNERRRRFEYHRIIPGTELSPGPLNRLGYPDITAFCEGRNGILWLGTPNLGMVRYDPVTRASTFFSFNAGTRNGISSNHILTIHDDPVRPGEVLWIGTDGGGLNRFDVDSGSFTVITERDGLPNNVVYAILSDDAGFLWMSTNKGLTKFDPVKMTFRNFDVNDGLQSNEFNRMEYLKTPDGRMYFGGINGYNVFRPSEITENEFAPPVVITGFKIWNMPVSFRDSLSPLKVPISETKEIVLDHTQNMITFEFSALEYSSPQNNNYAYMMEGFNEEWIYSGTTRSATYTNLDPGDYMFRVKASNKDGVWNETGQSVALTILPPFWKTWWFRSFAVLFFLSSGPFIYFRRTSALKKEHQRQHEFSGKLIESQEQERRRIAAELHDGIGQEVLIIRNRAVLALQRPDDPASLASHMKEISESAGEMAGSVRAIAHNLRPVHLERFGLTDSLTNVVEQTSASSSMIWTWEIADIDGMIPAPDEINVYRIVQEGINNILKHSAADEGRLEVKKEPGVIVIMLTDNGKGFDVESPKSKRGFGLSGIKERVLLVGGTVTITSVPGNTTLNFTIPVRNL